MIVNYIADENELQTENCGQFFAVAVYMIGRRQTLVTLQDQAGVAKLLTSLEAFRDFVVPAEDFRELMNSFWTGARDIRYTDTKISIAINFTF